MSASRRFRPVKHRQSGFTLIEVMIAILILAFGLLGFALLQTMSVRFSQSANDRTQATNLAYDILDQMRSNRLAAAQYGGNYTGTTTGCDPDAAITPGGYRTVWQCRLGSALGAGATGNVVYANGVATVTITWGDQRWDEVNPNTTFQVRSRL
ncbi:type IV pilus modification protein PilV [Pseudoxanthomonas suwonensis]|uniref:Pilus assembly protein PilV n=1 Tax=Pseudoxanthomonas suwonensis TaxID=314722 RepID=A0A0E3UNU5_9GAMM|nr:type IV pilus modification protein PilV [Pseudoxanthomonas suwonensis]AKC87476.1 pilus assembly protein PilV [Pseudoxanthomonas suwonensis]